LFFFHLNRTAVTVNIDANTQLLKTLDDDFTAQFTDGSATVDLSTDRGYFSGGLVNPADTSPPVIKKGTSFEINGSYANVKNNTSINSATLDKTCLLYIYASLNAGSVVFEYASSAPVFDSGKGGYYLNDKRALFKLVFIKDAVDKYVAKTFISDPWIQFDHYAIDNVSAGKYSSQAFSLSGAGNPSAKTVSLSAGGYVMVLNGAGGGGGGGLDGLGSQDFSGGPGGRGGSIAELVLLSANTSLTAFTGQGGAGAGGFDAASTYPGTGGGGGGSGTFLYNPDGYFLCAGGGGGGSGVTFNTSAGGGAGGGAGGSVGPGGGGGHGGYFFYQNTYFFGSSGGNGGGYNGGTGSTVTWYDTAQELNGGDARYSLPESVHRIS
jgi:hypothetical protein